MPQCVCRDAQQLLVQVHATAAEPAPQIFLGLGHKLYSLCAPRIELLLDLSAVQKEFDARRAKTIEFVTKTQEDLRGRLCCGGMDLYQQLLGISAHTLRHVEQMNEVKAQPGYPKS